MAGEPWLMERHERMPLDRTATDDLRGFLTLGIVLMHASLIWWGEWVICHNRDALNALAAVYMFLGIPSFFFLSGYVNAVSYRKWGFRPYVRRRLRRIGLPFLVGSTVCVPLMAYMDARFNEAGALWPAFLQRINPLHTKFTFYHLWFLFDLLLFALCMPFIHRAALHLVSGARRFRGLFILAYLAVHTIVYVAARVCQAMVVPMALIPIASVGLYLPIFMVGASCASIDVAKLRPSILKARYAVLWFCVGVCISVALRVWASDTLITKVIAHAMYVPNAYAGVLCMLLLTTSVRLRIAPLAFIWRNPYRVYILHQPILFVLGSLMPGSSPPWAGFAVTAIVCLGILGMVSLFLDDKIRRPALLHGLTGSANGPYDGTTHAGVRT